MRNAKFRTVLVIDDREIDCYVAQYIIKRSGFAEEVIVKNSVDGAMLLIRNATREEGFPDVIFLDIRMPLKNGFDFLDEFIMLPSTVQDQIKVVMYSTSALDEDLRRMQSYSVIRYFFTKPMSKEKLEEVARVLKESESAK